MTTSSKPEPLTASQVEELGEEYLQLESDIGEIKKKATEEITALASRSEEIRNKLIAQVWHYGGAHAEKSKLLYGIKLEVMGTFGMSSTVDAAAVEEFRLALVEEKQSRLLKRIFEKTIRWTLSPHASIFLRAEHEAGKLSNRLFMLFAKCTVSKPQSPRLVVRPREKAAAAAG
jgi:hypothetical protein